MPENEYIPSNKQQLFLEFRQLLNKGSFDGYLFRMKDAVQTRLDQQKKAFGEVNMNYEAKHRAD